MNEYMKIAKELSEENLKTNVGGPFGACIVKDGKIPPFTGELFRSDIWKCEDEGRRIPSVKNFGEWFSDSLL